jgi:hypothetical protein
MIGVLFTCSDVVVEVPFCWLGGILLCARVIL